VVAWFARDENGRCGVGERAKLATPTTPIVTPCCVLLRGSCVVWSSPPISAPVIEAAAEVGADDEPADDHTSEIVEVVWASEAAG
jgi:hypothetical protein